MEKVYKQKKFETFLVSMQYIVSDDKKKKKNDLVTKWKSVKIYTNSIGAKRFSNFLHDMSKVPHLYVPWGGYLKPAFVARANAKWPNRLWEIYSPHIMLVKYLNKRLKLLLT